MSLSGRIIIQPYFVPLLWSFFTSVIRPHNPALFCSIIPPFFTSVIRPHNPALLCSIIRLFLCPLSGRIIQPYFVPLSRLFLRPLSGYIIQPIVGPLSDLFYEKRKPTEILPPLLLTPPYIWLSLMPRAMCFVGLSEIGRGNFYSFATSTTRQRNRDSGPNFCLC